MPTKLKLKPGSQSVAVDRLREWPENPRKISEERFEQLKRSIADDPELLKARPLIALPDGTVIAGNMRLRAVKDLGWEEVPVFVVERTKREAREIALRDNNAFGEWVPEELAAMLAWIEKDGGDLAALGFEERELVAFMASLEPKGDPGKQPDPEPGPPTTKPGDMIELGDHRLLCGDATVDDDIARLMDGERAALLFTSPPYLDAREYEGGKDLSVDRLARFIPACAPFADLQAVNLGLVRRNDAIVPYWDAYIEAAQSAGLKLLSWNVWNRAAPFSMAQQTAMFPIEHEWIFVFGAERRVVRRLIPNKVPAKAGSRATNRMPDGELKSRRRSKGSTHRPLGTVQSLPPETGNDQEHPAVFPVALPQTYIAALVKQSEAVLDPMVGSGTTLIAAEVEGRRCFACELDPHYCDLVVKRWEQFTGKKAKRA